jgi:hypothetical protein
MQHRIEAQIVEHHFIRLLIREAASLECRTVKPL